MTPAKVAERLRRVEQQIRAFKELHASELQLILDELADINAELSADAAGPAATDKTVAADPAAASPKRAKWVAEQERRSKPLSRRELLRGRDGDAGS